MYNISLESIKKQIKLTKTYNDKPKLIMLFKHLRFFLFLLNMV